MIKLDRRKDAKGVFAQSGRGYRAKVYQLDKRINATDAKNQILKSHLKNSYKVWLDLYTQGQKTVFNAGFAITKTVSQLTQSIQYYWCFPNCLGELEKAVEAYTKAISLKPDHAETYNNMGNALRIKRS